VKQQAKSSSTSGEQLATLSPGALAGIAVGVALLALIVGVVVWRYKQDRDGKGKEFNQGYEMNGMGGDGRRSSSMYVDNIYGKYQDGDARVSVSSRSPSFAAQKHRTSMSPSDRLSRGSFAGANPVPRNSLRASTSPMRSPEKYLATGRPSLKISPGKGLKP